MVAGRKPVILVQGRHNDGILKMSSGSTIIMLSAASSAGGSDDDHDVECRTYYGIASVACVSQLLFCVLAATARRATHHDAGSARVVMALRRAGYSCRPRGVAVSIDLLPAFAYECPADAEGSALCAVCLEDVQRGETVRRLPACGHLFHKECIDMWLHSHTTCPLCRCELSPRRHTAKTIVTRTVASQSAADDVLPPV